MLTWNELGGLDNLTKCGKSMFGDRNSIEGEHSNRNAFLVLLIIERGVAVKDITGWALMGIILSGGNSILKRYGYIQERCSFTQTI